MKFGIVYLNPDPRFVEGWDGMGYAPATYESVEVAQEAKARTGICERVPSVIIPLPNEKGWELADLVRAALTEMTLEQRAEVFSDFCRHCGCRQRKEGVGCQCWNDE